LPKRDSAAPGGLSVFYALLVTETVSQIGSRISGLSVSIAVFQETGHATPLALVAFFTAIPAILAGGLFGALADSYDRRRLMMIANLGLVVTNGLLLVSFASGAFHLWHLYVLTCASAAFGALQAPAFMASITLLVPDRHRDRANAILQLSGPAAGVVAPGIAGLLYVLIGVVGAITINIATFILAILVLLMVSIPMPARTADGRSLGGSLWRRVFDGFRYLGARPILLSFCLYVALVNFLTASAGVLRTPYILDRTGGTATLGLVLGAFNAGAVTGAIVMGLWGGTRPRIHTVMLGLIMTSCSLILSGIARAPVTLGVSFFLSMFAGPMVTAACFSVLQAKVAPDVQGRVFAALSQLSALLTPGAYLIAGPLADKVFEPAVHRPAWRAVEWMVGAGHGAGIGLMLVIIGTLCGATSLIAYALPAIRRIEVILPDYEAATQPA